MDEPLFVSENQRAEVLLTTYARQLTTGGGKPGQGYPLVLLPASPCSPGSAGSTTDSQEPGFDISRSVSRTLTGGTCCEHGGRECRCTTTSQHFALNLRGREEGARPELDTVASLRGAEGGSSRSYLLTSSAAASPAKTCQSPDNAEGSTATGPACSSNTPESQTLFDPAGFSSRTYPASSLHKAVGTSGQSLERWPTSGTAWPGGFSTHVSSECRSDADGCSSSEPALSQILEPPQSVPAKYSLSARAAQGILRRAEKRGRTLPGHLAAALEAVAGHRTPNE